jgi:transcriptional regulator with XRE-family HTH domain
MRYPRIKELREEFKYKQQYVSSHLNLEQPEYSRLENGIRQPKPDELKKLAELFNKSVDFIIEGGVEYFETGYRNRDAVPQEILDRMMVQNERLIDELIQSKKENNEIIQTLLNAIGSSLPENSKKI